MVIGVCQKPVGAELHKLRLKARVPLTPTPAVLVKLLVQFAGTVVMASKVS